MKESQIVYEVGRYWVFDNRWSKPARYTVFRIDGATHSVSDVSYAHDADGPSLAKARADYLTKARP